MVLQDDDYFDNVDSADEYKNRWGLDFPKSAAFDEKAKGYFEEISKISQKNLSLNVTPAKQGNNLSILITIKYKFVDIEIPVTRLLYDDVDVFKGPHHRFVYNNIEDRFYTVVFVLINKQLKTIQRETLKIDFKTVQLRMYQFKNAMVANTKKSYNYKGWYTVTDKNQTVRDIVNSNFDAFGSSKAVKSENTSSDDMEEVTVLETNPPESNDKSKDSQKKTAKRDRSNPSNDDLGEDTTKKMRGSLGNRMVSMDQEIIQVEDSPSNAKPGFIPIPKTWVATRVLYMDTQWEELRNHDRGQYLHTDEVECLTSALAFKKNLGNTFFFTGQSFNEYLKGNIGGFSEKLVAPGFADLPLGKYTFYHVYHMAESNAAKASKKDKKAKAKITDIDHYIVFVTQVNLLESSSTMTRKIKIISIMIYDSLSYADEKFRAEFKKTMLSRYYIFLHHYLTGENIELDQANVQGLIINSYFTQEQNDSYRCGVFAFLRLYQLVTNIKFTIEKSQQYAEKIYALRKPENEKTLLVDFAITLARILDNDELYSEENNHLDKALEAFEDDPELL